MRGSGRTTEQYALGPAAAKLDRNQRRPNIFIVLTTLSVFTICTAYLAVSVCAFVSRIMPYHAFNESGIRELFNAITTINREFIKVVML